MKLIADSGSTKTDWCLVAESGTTERIATQGMNPVHQPRETIANILSHELLASLSRQAREGVTAIYFYGSGVTPDRRQPMRQLLQEAFPAAHDIQAESDLLGAARALCQHSEGIACILGTGANSCLYDGRQIVRNTPALGYILGDEGSGAVLGISFLNALYKGILPDSLRQEFEQTTGMDMGSSIQHVYRQPMANRFLASLSPFIHNHLDVPEVSDMVTRNFRLFLTRNIRPYGRPDLPVNAVGSIAFHYCEQLKAAAWAEGFTIGRVVSSPMEGLLTMHCSPTHPNSSQP